MASADRLIEVFNEAKARPAGAEREHFLSEACHDEPALKEQVLSLLQAHEGAGDFLKNTQVIPPLTVLTEKPGDKIDHYKLLQKIGEGGCGVVYMAEQEEPVRRRVALKVIKLGMDTKQVVARFEAEGQALAMMDHPNIAKVFDAGATNTGRPYFVMELVRGIKITEYCDKDKLPTEERLKLFIQVCQAIQHAHQKGVIHRDIKPSNILVTVNDGVAVPKVIDFGIAKATQGRLTDKTLFTAFEQFIGTPAYMSPEQAEMTSLDIDTRADVYSLGVLLYELLSGNTPFDAEKLVSFGIAEIRRIIREQEPPKPSTRLNTLGDADRRTVAQHRHTDPPNLLHLIRGDLDWIVMKCLEKDRTRRYETANGLAMDLQRHLDNEPVIARPPSSAYRFQKLVRRNKVLFAAAAAVVGALLLGVIVSTWQAVRATRAKQEAVKARAQEADQRRQAEDHALVARQKAYASDMNLAQRALAEDNLGRAQELLSRQRPQTDEKDLRGWEWRYLWQFCQSDALYTLCQKSSEINSLSVSHDGEWLAVGLFDGRVSAWNLRTRQEIGVCPSAGPYLARVAFSPRNSVLAYSFATGDRIENPPAGIRLWDAATRQPVGNELPIRGVCRGLAFSEDGRTLVTAARKGEREGCQITVWQIPEGKQLVDFSSPGQAYFLGTTFAVARDGSMAACAISGARISLFDLATGKERWTTKGADEYVAALAFSPDGKILASGPGYVESAIRLWDVASGKELARLEGHHSWVSSLVFWPDGKTLASASGDQTIRLWDLADLTNVQPARVLRGHKLEVWQLALLPNARTLVSGSKDGLVMAWDTEVTRSKDKYVSLKDRSITWRFAPDSKSVVGVGRDGRVRRWSGVDFQEPETLLEIGGVPSDACISDDCRWAAATSRDSIVKVWDLQQRRLLRQIAFPTNSQAIPIKFLADGKILIVAMPDDRVAEWEIATGKQMRFWQGAGGWNAITFSPDEQMCLTLGFWGGASLKNLTDGRERKLPLDTREVYDAAFSPDGKRVAAASTYGFAKLWDFGTQRELATLRGFLLGVHSVAFSPDGQRLALGGTGKEAVKIWDVESHQELLTLEGHGSVFSATAFSPDGSVLGSMTLSGQLHLWRAPTWAEIEAAEKSQANNDAK